MGRSWLTRVARIGLVGALAVAPMLSQASPAAADNHNRGDDHGGGLRHVFVIMMENTGYASLIGNPNAPWINSAAQTYGLATNYFGVTHPSQPNYIAATSGSTNGVVNDGDTTINVPNIVDQLESHDKTWKAYMQSLSLAATKLSSSGGNQLYERKHNPFVSYADVQSNPDRMANIVDFTQFASDLANGDVPNYVWISPDQCHDMHGRFHPNANDPCDFSQVQPLIATGDLFLSQTVSAITHSRAWRGNSVILITWDESDFTGTGTGPFGFGDTSGCCDANPGGGHVVTLTISHDQEEPTSSDVAYNHYSLLRTIQNGFHLGCLAFTCDDENVRAMNDLVGRSRD
jgi:phosphatidylinositol-3-phosphatase